MAAAVTVSGVVSLKCHYCSKFFPWFRVFALGKPDKPAQTICDYCLEWHNKAIEFLAGRALPGCQACGASWEFLRDSAVAVEQVRMYVVPRDGIYQVLCATCVLPYVSKRADLYAGTPFGTNALNL